MKTKITALAALIASTSAFAHTAALPHVHEGSRTNWVPAVACVAVLLIAGAFAWKALKSRSAK